MSVQIIINGETAAEALVELSHLAGGMASKTAAAEPVSPETTQEKPKRQRQAKMEPEKQPDPEPAVEDDDDFLGEDEGDEPIPTDVQLREIAKAKSDADPKARPAIKALLTKYGAANVTAIPEAKRLAFKKELEAI